MPQRLNDYVPTHIPALVQKENGPHVYLPDDPDFAWKI